MREDFCPTFSAAGWIHNVAKRIDADERFVHFQPLRVGAPILLGRRNCAGIIRAVGEKMLSYRAGYKIGSFMAASSAAPRLLTIRESPVDGKLAAAANMLSRNGFIVIAPAEASVDEPPAGKRFHAIHGRKNALSLTRTEGRLIETLVAARGAWCSRRDLMQTVWTRSTPSDSALSVHMFNLRAKFRECANARNLLETSQGGVRLDPDALKFLR